jgi:toxin HigB-1
MIVQFEDDYLAILFTGGALKGKPRYSEVIVTKFKKTVLILKHASNTVELSKIRSLNFEALKGDKTGLFSVRVDLTYRIEFRITKDIVEIISIVELSKHYQ